MTTYVKESDLRQFARELARRVPEMKHLNDQRTIQKLWKVMTEDLHRYAINNGMGRVDAVSAESGYALTGSVNPIPPYIQREGVALDRQALVRLPLDSERWQYSLFGYNEDVWSLFHLWLQYLRDPRA